MPKIRIECTFGRLRGRFKRFRYTSKNGDCPSFYTMFLFACTIHNIIELYSLDEWSDFITEFENDNSAYIFDDAV